MVTRIIAVAAALLLAPATARAVPMITFDFVPVTVSPLDTVTIQVEITNDSTAGESITGTLGAGFNFGTIPATYGFVFVNMIAPLAANPLLAGQSRILDFAVLTPTVPVAAGIYTSGAPTSITFEINDTFSGPLIRPGNQFVLNVQETPVQSVPEPASFSLVALGGAAALARRHWTVKREAALRA